MKPALAIAAFTAFGAGFCASAPAAEIQSLEVDHDGGRYHVNMHVRLDVPAERAYAAFADPHNLTHINPAVQEVQLLLPRDVLYTKVRVCVGLFCKVLRQVQQMRYAVHANGGSISAVVLPEESDLRSGTAQWEFRGVGGHTEMEFDARLEPAFWIPPLLGPWLVENSMRQEAERTSAGIERLAQPAAP